jgi:hypothetical protein
MRRFVFMCLISAALVPHPALAPAARAGCISYGDYIHPLGAWDPPSYPQAMAYAAPHLFVADQYGALTVVDAADPAFMESRGSVQLPAPARAIALGNGVVACALETAALQLVDVSNPAAPALLGAAALPCWPQDIALYGHYAYLPAWQYGADNHGVYVVDIADPNLPVVLTHVDVGEYPTAITVTGSRAYVLDGVGLIVLDLSVPCAPVVLGQVGIPGEPRYVATRGDYTYIVCEAQEYPTTGNGLYVVNTSAPAKPWLVGMAIVDDTSWDGIGLWDHYLITGRGDLGMAFIDISAPESPEVAQFVGAQEFPRGFLVAGDLLFASSSFVEAFGLQEPSLPGPVAVVPGLDGWITLASRGDYAYAAGLTSGGVDVVNMADPEHPVYAGSTPLGCEYVQAIALTDPGASPAYAYVGGNRAQNEIYVLDLSDPAAPQHVATLPVQDDQSALDVEGGYLYGPRSYGSLGVYSLADPVSPQFLSEVNLTFSFQVVKAAGATVFVGRRISNNARLLAIDASDPHALRVAGISSVATQPYDFWIEGALMYVADGDGGLLILDITDPADPVKLSRLVTARCAQAVRVEGGFAYVAANGANAGVQVIDVSDPTAPFTAGFYPAARACDLEIINGHGLVATWFGAPTVMPLECDAAAGIDEASARHAPSRLSVSSNPSLGAASLSLSLPRAMDARVELWDVQGRRVRQLHSGALPGGTSRLRWDGRDDQGDPVAAGAYFARLAAGGTSESRRFILVR